MPPFLPANDPEILVYVMLDDPNNARTDYPSILAAPVVGNIISEVAPTWASPPTARTAAVPSLHCAEPGGARVGATQVQLNIKSL